jgi:TolB protein
VLRLPVAALIRGSDPSEEVWVFTRYPRHGCEFYGPRRQEWLTPPPMSKRHMGMTSRAARNGFSPHGRRPARILLHATGLAIATLGVVGTAPVRAEPIGAFEAAADVGKVHVAGSSQFDEKKKEYRLTGGGENMWETQDGFHYLHRKAAGDLVLRAAVRFPEKKGNTHRKAGWVVRQSLDADAPYADAIVHADGLISLQYRLTKGGPTLEVQSPWKAPATVQLERTGDLFSLSVAKDGKTFRPVGSVTVPLGPPEQPVHVGLAVCSHEADKLATAVLTGVELDNPGVVPQKSRVLQSQLETITVPGGQRQVIYTTGDHIEAPNWSRDGRTLLFNSQGKLFSIPVKGGGTPTAIDTGTATRLNNDHGLSPDGKSLVISYEPKDHSMIAVLPAKGGEPRLVTALGPSYWHGWSPDGKTLVYCAERNGEYDVYAIAASAENSREEKRLTTATGLDDGPDYAPDGKSIYFNSVRTGHMRIFRMKPDGSEQTQITDDDEWEDWFPHPSPNGKWMVFLSFQKGVEGHPPNKDVVLRLQALPHRPGKTEPRVLTHLFGGQGTVNVPSWSPDSRSFAFVSYRFVKSGTLATQPARASGR